MSARRNNAFTIELLPDPFGPASAVSFPRAPTKLTPSTAFCFIPGEERRGVLPAPHRRRAKPPCRLRGKERRSREPNKRALPQPRLGLPPTTQHDAMSRPRRSPSSTTERRAPCRAPPARAPPLSRHSRTPRQLRRL